VEEQINNNQRIIRCKCCQEAHSISSRGFNPNIRVENLIKINVEYLKIGEEYKSAYDRFRKIASLFQELNELKDDPELYINEVISQIKRKVDLKREELKAAIDDEALQLIADLDEYERECREKKKDLEINQIENKLKDWQDDIESWRQKLDCIQIDLNTWKKIDSECTWELFELEQELVSCKKRLLLNKFDKFENRVDSIGTGFDVKK